MSDVAKSTVAQLLFVGPPALNFAHAVAEIEQVLAASAAEKRALTWDTDDVAVFDLDGSRIVIGYAERLSGPHFACLTISVGYGPQVKTTALLAQRRHALCRSLSDRMAARYPVDQVIVQETDSPVTAERIEALLETLPRGAAALEPLQPALDVDRLLARMTVEMETRTLPPVPNFVPPDKATLVPLAQRGGRDGLAEPVANDTPALPRPRDPELERIRAALYAEDEVPEPARQSAQMRLAVHAMNSTLILVYLPVGAAMLTYSLLRGENLRASSQAMVLTALFVTAAQSPLGQQLLGAI